MNRLGKGRLGEGDSAIAFSPDGRILAVATMIGVWLYNAHTQAEIAPLMGHTGPVSCVSFSPDGETLASGSGDWSWWNGAAVVKLWSVPKRQEIATLEGYRSINSVSFSPDGKMLAIGELSNTVRVCSIPTGQEIVTLEGHNDYVESVCFSPSGRMLATGSRDETAKLW